jgi:acyl-CoA reductase-like NAD-dependent aldehyde dehydrogenase
MTASDRGRVIWRIGDLILDNLEELAELESLDNGKPIGVARVADVPLAADLFHYMAGWAPGEGLRPCRPDDPGAYIDLDRYAYWLAYGDPDIDGNDPGGVEADEG